MKKLFVIFCFSFLVSFLNGCNSEEPMPSPTQEETGVVEISLAINSKNKNLDTRSLAPGYKFSDGTSISVVKCYVYNKAHGTNSQPDAVFDISVADLKGNASIPLPKYQTFDLVFLATSIPQTNSSSKLFYNASERSLNIDYSQIYSNDEEIDCFFASLKNISGDSTSEYSVTLYRPLAQMNIGATDVSSYNNSNPIKDVSVTVSGVYNKINLMDGSVVGEPVSANFLAAPIPSGQDYPVNNSSYLAMNYLLVNSRKLVDVSISINHQNSSTSSLNFDLEDIAVERNYQTNVYINSLGS